MFELHLLAPIADNLGHTFAEEHHAVFETAILDRFGGFTRYPAETVGGWRNDDGRVFLDRARVYGIAVRSIAQGAVVAELVAFARSHYRQEAIFIRYLGIAEIL